MAQMVMAAASADTAVVLIIETLLRLAMVWVDDGGGSGYADDCGHDVPNGHEYDDDGGGGDDDDYSMLVYYMLVNSFDYKSRVLPTTATSKAMTMVMNRPERTSNTSNTITMMTEREMLRMKVKISQ